MKWKEEDWKRLHPEGSHEGNNPPRQSSPDVQQPVSNDILEDVFDLDFFDEQAFSRELQEFIEEDQTAIDDGQYEARQNPVPTALHDHTYPAQDPQGQTASTLIMDPLPEAQYWCPQNLGSVNVPLVPNVDHMQDPQYVKLPTFTPPTNAVPAMTYHEIPMHSPGKTTAPTLGEQKGNDFGLGQAVNTAFPVKAPVSQKEETVAEDPYIKKPLNAFMRFLKQNRASAEAELGVRTSAVVNKYLGEQWKSLSEEERGIYVGEAKAGAFLHAIVNHGWTNKINYRNKRKRIWTKVVRAKKT